eukprot:1426923-Pyramimonas_sp.AAC.2
MGNFNSAESSGGSSAHHAKGGAPNRGSKMSTREGTKKVEDVIAMDAVEDMMKMFAAAMEAKNTKAQVRWGLQNDIMPGGRHNGNGSCVAELPLEQAQIPR